ncbi:MAG: 50S ribosomal protein L1 [Pyramidobacter sp.]|nr:50S ribosomal protein L1 [Pyramidobacter sp.]
MAKVSKRRAELLKKIEPLKSYTVEEAVDLILETSKAKFDESIEIHIRLNVDPRRAEQQVRSTIALPNGTGKTKRVLVLTTTDKGAEAQAAGADYVGSSDLVDKIKAGWVDFDAVVATPEMMRVIGPLGKVLGPRGLMPSAKAGTVTMDVASAVKEIKAGRVEYRVDKFGILHNAIGKASFGKEKLLQNIAAYYGAVLKSRPTAVKGTYVKSFSLSSTMGVGVRVDALQAQCICAPAE